MQKLYDFRSVKTEDYPLLKKMWCDVFGDSQEVVDNFFNETVQPDNIIAVFYGNEPVSALYLLDSTICVDGKSYQAYYVYGVSTLAEHRGKGLMKKCLDKAYEKAACDNVSYLYLVPAEESLFTLYGKAGYKIGFYNVSCELHRNDYPKGNYTQCVLTFDEYIKYRQSADFTLATINRKAFNSFYNPVGDDIKIIHVKGEGYAVAEICDDECVIHEVFGNESVILGCVFDIVSFDTLTLKKSSKADGTPYGMYIVSGDAPDFADGFFGIPYGG